tara:strand:+ start:875 stop:1222 length:348 start_codon:yes stop_codon:yes gene_type:complete
MDIILNVLQVTIAISVVYVWIFRYFNVVKEFEKFGLSDITRNFVGASKISLATLLIVGVWYPSFTFLSALLMGMFMLSAQYFHFKTGSLYIKRLPSLILLILCILCVLITLETIK